MRKSPSVDSLASTASASSGTIGNPISALSSGLSTPVQSESSSDMTALQKAHSGLNEKTLITYIIQKIAQLDSICLM